MEGKGTKAGEGRRVRDREEDNKQGGEGTRGNKQEEEKGRRCGREREGGKGKRKARE